ncbi:hypothetical protein BDAP_000845 [Binucleata daphniae]
MIDRTDDRGYNDTSISYNLSNQKNISIDQEKLDILKNYIIKYFNEKENKNNKEILLFENVNNYYEYMRNNCHDVNDDILLFLSKFANNTIAVKRGFKKKITYISKTDYYKDREQMNDVIVMSEIQERFISDLQKDIKHEIKYEMNFDVLRMLKPYTVRNICLLAIELDHNIKQLTVFTKKYLDDLYECIKKKHINAISSYLYDLKRKEEIQHTTMVDSVSSSIEKINAIKSPIQDIEKVKRTKTLVLKNIITKNTYQYLILLNIIIQIL